uniref:CCHC-type domain-containing protein n=1 Tax=Tanacetum cinerariifolium TaxID=118510 RepID=A0A6L2LDD6_TANCI|nr:hypothetical protein [Tanacetum cinerariifolium]
MWKRVEHLMRGTIQNKVDRETCFTNEFDQFVAEPGEALVFIYNRFAQLMDDLERNDMHFPIVTINTKFLNSLQPEWLKYVSQVRLAKRLTVDTFDDLFDYLQQFEKLVNTSRAKKLEKSHVPLALVAHTGSGNTSIVQCYNCSGKGHYARNCPKPRVRDSKYIMKQMLMAKQDEAGVILTDEQNDFLFADASRMEEIEEHSVHICLMAKIQPTNDTSDAGPSYDSAFVSEVQSSSINKNEEQMYPTHTKMINSTIGDDQIDSNIIFDTPNGNVNSSSVEKDTHVLDLYTVDYQHINALYKDFVPQKEPSAEQKYFPSSFVPSDKNSNTTASIPASMLNNSLHDEIEQIKRKSIEIQEGLRARIKILKKDVQRCEKQSVDFELKLQHEKEKHKWDSTLQNNKTKSLDYSWISKMEKLKHENVSLDFQVQSLIKERDNVKVEYQKLFDSIKKTRSQTQKEIDELIVHVSKKTYAYGAIRAENQNLLFITSELKTRLKNVKKKMDVSKTEENHVVLEPVTLQTSPNKQKGANSNKNVIAHGMYKVVTPQESQTHNAKSSLYSTRMNAASSVRRSMNKDSHDKNSALANSKNSAKKVAVYVRKNKQTDNTSMNVISNKEYVIDVDVVNASKAKTLLCVSCMQNVLIPCHDKCLINHRLNMHSNARRTLSTKSRTPKSSDTTYVVLKIRNVQRNLQTISSGNTSTVQCYNCSGKNTMLGIVQSQEFETRNTS